MPPDQRPTQEGGVQVLPSPTPAWGRWGRKGGLLWAQSQGSDAQARMPWREPPWASGMELLPWGQGSLTWGSSWCETKSDITSPVDAGGWGSRLVITSGPMKPGPAGPWGPAGAQVDWNLSQIPAGAWPRKGRVRVPGHPHAPLPPGLCRAQGAPLLQARAPLLCVLLRSAAPRLRTLRVLVVRFSGF